MWRGIVPVLLALPTVALAQDLEEVDLAMEVLADLQQPSFDENREFCGYIGLNAEGELVASDATPGTLDSCLADDPVEIEVIFASYHTHGAFSEDYFNEVPSGEDMESDEAEGIDGYVATPGGRLWYIDTERMVASQICGLGCLPVDPDFIAGIDGVIQESYAYDDLIELLND